MPLAPFFLFFILIFIFFYIFILFLLFLLCLPAFNVRFLVDLFQLVLFSVLEFQLIRSTDFHRVIRSRPIDKQDHILRRNPHVLKKFIVLVGGRDLDLVPVLDQILLRHCRPVYLDRFGKRHLIPLEVDNDLAVVVDQIRDLLLRRCPERRLLKYDDIVCLDIVAEAHFLPVHVHMCALTVLALGDTVLAVDRVVQFLAAPRKEAFPGKVSLHCRIRDCQFVVVVQFDPVPIEGNVDKIIVLFIVCETDTDRRDDGGVLQRIVGKIHIPHNLLAAERHSLRIKPQLRRNQLVKSLDLAAAADNKHGTRRTASVQFLDRAGCKFCHPLDLSLADRDHLLGSDHLLHAHDILIDDLFLRCRRRLDHLRRRKVDQTCLRQKLCQRITRTGDHPKRRHASVIRDRDIRRARPDVDHRDI